MTQTNPKDLLIAILKDKIVVYEDDEITPITGVVAGTWYDERIIGDHKWQVSVGPSLDSTSLPAEIGAVNWKAINVLLLNIWIPILENPSYTPERLRFSVKEEIKRLLKIELVNTVSDIRYTFLSGWRDIDDRDNQMLRIEATVQVEWYET